MGGSVRKKRAMVVNRRVREPTGRKACIITGGAGGIGRAITTAFAQEGFDVAVFGLRAGEDPLVKRRLEAILLLGKKCLYLKADVTKRQEVQQAVAETIETLGRVDVLVNNAGGGMNPTPLEILEEEDWDRVVDLNLKGTYLCTHFVIAHMKEKRSGKIINISSQGGRSKSELSNLPYASAKAGILGFTRQLAHEVGRWGICVNAIAPGIILTEKAIRRWEERPEEERRGMLEAIPLRRLGTPEEIAQVAVFLASDKASYITGATIDVNGGRFMM